jgi:hypothetical protein
VQNSYHQEVTGSRHDIAEGKVYLSLFNNSPLTQTKESKRKWIGFFLAKNNHNTGIFCSYL